MSWSRAHDNYAHKDYNVKSWELVGEENEAFKLLEAYGSRLKKGKLKFICKEIIKKGAESAESLKTRLDEWYAYDPKKGPKVAERKKDVEEKAKKKAEQKRKRQVVMKGESTSGSPKEKPAENLAWLEHLVIFIPPTSDFAAIMRVYECVAQIAEAAEDCPEIPLLKKKSEEVNSDLEADLHDREDKLAYCNKELVPDLLEENRYMWGIINSLSSAGAQIAGLRNS